MKDDLLLASLTAKVANVMPVEELANVMMAVL
jgi:hypothetical protein